MLGPDVQPFKAQCKSGHAPEARSDCVRDECNFREFQRDARSDQRACRASGMLGVLLAGAFSVVFYDLLD